MISSGSNLRNLIVAVCIVVGIFLLTRFDMPASARPQRAPLLQTGALTFDPDEVEVQPGDTVNASATLENTGNTTDTFTISSNIGDFAGWSAIASTDQVELGPGATTNITYQISAPADATPDESINFIATATSSAGDFNGFLTVNVGAPATVDVRLAIIGDREKEDTPGSAVDYDVRVTNNSDIEVTVNLGIDDVVNCSREIPGCDDSVDQGSIRLNPNQSDDFSVSVLLPSDAPVGERATTRVVARVDGEVQDTLDVFTEVIEATATPTETPTRTETPSPTETLGPVCTDIFEDDDSRGSAKILDVNLPQPQPVRDPDFDDRRAICPAGDEDWLVFGAVEGKVYTIDTYDVAPGLDLTLTLFNEDGEEIAFNDDFFDRTDQERTDLNAEDIDPRIDSWQAPYTGRYYIRVRDAADRGGTDRTYTIVLRAESYGPTPQTVLEVCEDQFEPDGLPEQANLITSNEIQIDRRLCPTGDADWLTFFGKQNKSYFIYTDTREYAAGNPVNPDTEAGADTVLVLTDRDGVSVIDINDDIPNGDTLDSQIEFEPQVDGFYFIQVKNVGDIGNQFIRYDVALELCIPGRTDCGRDIIVAASSTDPVTSSRPTPTIQRSPAPSPNATGTGTPATTPVESRATPTATIEAQ